MFVNVFFFFFLLSFFLFALPHCLLQLKQKLASATSAIKSVFGQEETRQDAVSLICMELVPYDVLKTVTNQYTFASLCRLTN